MDKRQWLRERGFDVGERGRFSAEMIEALKGYEEESKQNSLREETEDAGLPPEVARLPVREPKELHGYTVHGEKVGFVMCSYCSEHMMWCQCDKITAPRIVTSCKDPLVRLHASVL